MENQPIHNQMMAVNGMANGSGLGLKNTPSVWNKGGVNGHRQGTEGESILIRGAKQHNLKNVDVTIPRHKLVVITGVSGSGKSSLAFDTLYAEGQRRYVESLSAYARQFLGQMEKPKVDQIIGLSPAIAIEQKTVSKNPRSTVGTVTDIVDYLRVLYARAGTPHCPHCGRDVSPQSSTQITNQLMGLSAGTRFQILAPIVRHRKGSHVELLEQAKKDGYSRARIDGELIDLMAKKLPSLAKTHHHTIELIIDRLAVPTEFDDSFRGRLADSVETALKAAEGLLTVLLETGEEQVYSQHLACPPCNVSFHELTPQMFSFNAPTGMCPECSGLGVTLSVDAGLVVPKPHLSLLDGASPWYGEARKKKGSSWMVNNLLSMAEHYGVDLEQSWQDLPEKFRHVLLYGSNGEKIRFKHQSEDGSWQGEAYREAKGILHQVERLFRQTKSEWSRRHYMQFMSEQPCPTCKGERLCAEARFVTVAGTRLPEASRMTIQQAYDWICHVPDQLSSEWRELTAELVQEIAGRLRFLLNVGLHYLTLDRPAPTLSGGEGQRIRLASQLGCGLVGVLYVLDEPSIGLHPRDHQALIGTLEELRNMGNTVLVVEHDADTMNRADWLIDMGPGAGAQGGWVISAGTPTYVMSDPHSLTGKYLRGDLAVQRSHYQQPTTNQQLLLHGARMHNLKNVTIQFPLGQFVCVTGVSGSGKSSLITKTLYPALSRALHNSQMPVGAHDRLEGLEHLDKVIHITQDPIGRTPRSNPATYIGLYDEIRKVFAGTPEAKTRGYTASRFSFNVKGGRCESCDGHGQKKVEMHFLADVWVTCRECAGKRYNRETLAVHYKGKTIADVLEMDVQEALTFFAAYPAIQRMLQTLHDVGLDYMRLGQSALTLSGGEAQRIKLAKELSRKDTGRTVYILDEPTTGLHFADIQKLLDVLHRLVSAGNTVIVIEHNLDVIKTADWIIDLGPEGGDGGGYVIAEGSPKGVAGISTSLTGQFLQFALATA